MHWILFIFVFAIVNTSLAISDKGPDTGDTASFRSISQITPLLLHTEDHQYLWSFFEILPLENVPKEFGSMSDMQFNDDYVVLSDYTENRFLVYSRCDGKLITDIQIEGDIGDCVGQWVNWEENHLVIGNNAKRQLLKYNFEGDLVSSVEVPFFFMDFHYFPNVEHYLFYIPYSTGIATHYGRDNPTFYITDNAFNIKSELFPMPERTHEAPYFSSFRFHCEGDLCYYNAVFSDKIMSIDAHGSVNLIYNHDFATDAYYEAIEKVISNKARPDRAEELANRMGMNRFFVTPNSIILDKSPRSRHENIIFDRRLNKGYIVGNRMPVTNFGQHFQFAYTSPTAANNGEFCHLWQRERFEKVLGYVEDASTLDRLPDVSDHDLILMFYHPDMNFLSNKSQMGLEFAREKNRKIDASLYPNPAEDILNVSMKCQGKSHISIISSDGQIMERQVIECSEQDAESVTRSLDVSALPDGLYIVQISSKGESYSSAIVIQ